MRRTWPGWIRVALAVMLVVVLLTPAGSFYWTRFNLVPAGVRSDGHPVDILAPVGELLEPITARTWRFAIAAGDALCAAILALLLYAIISRFRGRHSAHQSLCRNCRAVLRGLAVPQCPNCGTQV